MYKQTWWDPSSTNTISKTTQQKQVHSLAAVLFFSIKKKPSSLSYTEML